MNNHLYNTEGWIKSESRKTKRMGIKCKAERNFLIKSEIGRLIKKQMKCFLAHKKIEKELEKQNKDYIMVNVPSPMERVKEFRSKEKQNNVRKLEKFMGQSEKIESRVNRKLQDKKEESDCRSIKNLNKMLKVRRNYQNLQQENFDKVQILKQTLKSKHSRLTSRTQNRNIRSTDNLNENRVSTAQNLFMIKQDHVIHSYMRKMKEREERCLKKEISLEEKNKLKSQPKCLINKRKQQQEDMMNKLEAQLQKKLEKFQKNRNAQIEERQDRFYNKETEKQEAIQKIWERKIHNQEVHAHKRMESVKNKLERIKQIEMNKHKKVNLVTISQSRNFENMENDFEKEAHNDKMRQIYNVLKKLKGLDNVSQLNDSQVKILEQNLDVKSHGVSQILEFVHMSKDKFFEKKQKQDEEKMKKCKKNNSRMI